MEGPLANYLREIDRTPLLGPDEEQRLALRVRAGDLEARDHMIRANLRLVVHLAKIYARKHGCVEEFIQNGTLGLMIAVRKFDPTKKVRFSTYASYWIRQQISYGIKSQSRLIRLPCYVHELLSKWRKCAHELSCRQGSEPEFREVAARLGISTRLQCVAQDALFVEKAAPHQSNGHNYADLLEAPSEEDPLIRSDERSTLEHAFKSLNSRERFVIRRRFGFDGDLMTLREIGEQLDGMSRERVRQIEIGAMKKLRSAMGV